MISLRQLFPRMRVRKEEPTDARRAVYTARRSWAIPHGALGVAWRDRECHDRQWWFRQDGGWDEYVVHERDFEWDT